MPLDEASRRFAFLLQRDLRRIEERGEERAARGEVVKFDAATRVAVMQTRHGESVARLFGEVLATYAPHDRILRWAWAGRSSSAPPTHGDVVFREGQSRGVPQLSMSVVGDLDPEDATALVKLGALVARAEGVHQERSPNGDTDYIALFDRPPPSEAAPPARESRFSVPPPPVAEKSPEAQRPAGRAYRSIPPIREIFEPRTSSSPPRSTASAPAPPRSPSSLPVTRKLREPSRELFLPVANAALSALQRGSKGYVQGLFVVTLDREPRERHEELASDKRRIVVQLVVIDMAGILRALDPPNDLVEAAATMVESDRREGNGHWRKLSARITPKTDGGATLHVDVT
ncbi:MAG: hypothetical protein NVS3B10_21350 [Polyangiales bacterium]